MPADKLHLSALGSVGIRVAGTLLAFAISALLSRALGAAGFGLYSYAFTIVMLVAVPIHSALSHLTVREIAASHRAGTASISGVFIKWADRISLLYAGLVAILVGCAWLLLGEGRTSGEGGLYPAVAVGLVLVFTMPLAASRSSAVRGMGYGNIGQVPDLLVRPGILVMVVTAIMMMGYANTLDPVTVMGIHGTGGMAAVLVSVWLLRRIVYREGHVHKNLTHEISASRTWGKAFLSLYVLGSLQLLNSSIDILILGALHDSAQVGIYRVVTQLGALTSFGLIAINPIMHGWFSRLYADKDVEKFQHIVSLSVGYIVMIALPPFLLLMFFGQSLLSYVYGAEFISGYHALQIILLGQLANVAFGSVAALLNMTGYERDTLKGILVSVVINLVLNIALVPKFGINGAAIANAVSMVLWNMLLWGMVRRRIGVESSIYGTIRLAIKKVSHEKGIK